MTNIIFQYTPYETNWLDPAWRKAKMEEPILQNIMYFETFYSEYTDKQKARMAKMTRNSYVYWKHKLKRG